MEPSLWNQARGQLELGSRKVLDIRKLKPEIRSSRAQGPELEGPGLGGRPAAHQQRLERINRVNALKRRGGVHFVIDRGFIYIASGPLKGFLGPLGKCSDPARLSLDPLKGGPEFPCMRVDI